MHYLLLGFFKTNIDLIKNKYGKLGSVKPKTLKVVEILSVWMIYISFCVVKATGDYYCSRFNFFLPPLLSGSILCPINKPSQC